MTNWCVMSPTGSTSTQLLDDLLEAPRAAGPGRATGWATLTRPAPARAPSPSAERAFLAMCLAPADRAREYLERLHDDHFSSSLLRRVRDHLLAHFDDPLAACRTTTDRSPR